jgi:ABC-type phosphate/phosphonate transport system permease subunit
MKHLFAATILAGALALPAAAFAADCSLPSAVFRFWVRVSV